MKGPIFEYIFLSNWRLLLWLFFLISYQSQAQIKGFTVLNESGEPLEHVNALSTDGNHIFFSNEKGFIPIPDPKNLLIKEVVLSHVGYAFDTVNVLSLKPNSVIIMHALSTNLDGITVVGRLNQSEKDFVAQSINIISANQIVEELPFTTADALTKSGEVFVQKSQFGGGSPILRGFEANRILLVIDGIRLNNAIYRSGHLQNVISIDQYNIKSMEVISGAGSLVYGSDALGGVIQMRTKDPLPFNGQNQDQFHIISNYSSAANGYNLHGDYQWSNEKYGSITSFAYSHFGDLKSGKSGMKKYPEFGLRRFYVSRFDKIDSVVMNSDPYKQIGSAYNQIDLSQKNKIKVKENLFATLAFQYSTTNDVPRYDQLNEYDTLEGKINPTYAQWNYGPQKRLLAYAHVDYYPHLKWADKVSFNTSYQYLQESRFSRKFRDPIRHSSIENLHIAGVNVDINKDISPELELLYGGEAYVNQLRSEAFEQNIETESEKPSVFSRYPSGKNYYFTGGAYGLVEYHKDKWRWESGLRYSLVSSNIIYQKIDNVSFWPESFYDHNAGVTMDFSATAGMTYSVSNHFDLALKISKAFRAPNIDDQAKIRVKGDQVLVPNLSLKPEDLYALELGLQGSFGDKKPSWNVNGFYTFLDDAIIQGKVPGPEGNGMLYLQNEWYTTYANINAESTTISGLSATVNVPLHPYFTISGSSTYTYGRNKIDLQQKPAAHIPPYYGKVEAHVEKDKFSLAAYLLFNGAKKIEDYSEDSSDNLDYATAEGTPAWQVYNITTSYELGNHIKLHFNIENIFNRLYRPFSSGINAPGRNFVFGLRYSS